MKIKKEYERWLANAVADTDVAAELKAMDYVEVEDAFYRDLAFGTGGLRGVIGAGTNRMNIYTVAKASQGLADYLKKDGVDGAYMICEMFSYYATRGISLLDKLDELYKTYGYCLNTLHSYEFDGSAGFARMQSIMQAFRGGIKEFGGKKVVRLLDYVQGLDGLPKSDVLKFLLEDNCSLVVRPSGTEPKLKIYISVSAENKEMAEEVEDEIAKTAEKWIC